MKDRLKKIATAKGTIYIRNFFITFLSLIFLFAILYVLINSPA